MHQIWQLLFHAIHICVNLALFPDPPDENKGVAVLEEGEVDEGVQVL